MEGVVFIFLSVFVVHVCVLFIYIISISIIHVSHEEPSLIAANQSADIWLLQVSNFYKEKTLRKVNLEYQWIIHSV